MKTNKPMLVGCEVLPPMEAPAKSPLAPRTATPKRKPTKDRFATINAFCDASIASLDRSTIAVWLLLWRDTKPDGLARTSQADLARRAGTVVWTVERAIGELVDCGLLQLVRRGGLRKGPSTYRVRPLADASQPDTQVGKQPDARVQNLPTPASAIP